MAFSEDQKAAVRQYLGFSELFHDFDSRLEGQMDALGTSRPSAVTRAQALLTKLAALDAKIDDSALNNLDLERAEDVTFLGPKQIEALQDYGRSLIQQLAVIFEVQVQRDYYGSEAGSGGVIPLG